jgi:hypothetical protein
VAAVGAEASVLAIFSLAIGTNHECYNTMAMGEWREVGGK